MMLPGSCTDSHSREVQMLFYTIIFSFKILKGKKKCLVENKIQDSQGKKINYKSPLLYILHIFFSVSQKLCPL